MRRFDKKKVIQKLNERLNKKGNSLTENSWADDLETDAFPEEFKGMYDDEVMGDDPHGEHLYGAGPKSWENKFGEPQIDPSDFDSAYDSEQRGMRMDADRFNPQRDEFIDAPAPSDVPYSRDTRSLTPNSPFGESEGEDMVDPVLDGIDLSGDTGQEFPDFNPESMERMRQDRLYRESIGRDMNVVSEQSLKAFQSLCGLKLIKEEKKTEIIKEWGGFTVKFGGKNIGGGHEAMRDHRASDYNYGDHLWDADYGDLYSNGKEWCRDINDELIPLRQAIADYDRKHGNK